MFNTYRRSIADVFRIQVVSNSDVRSPIITLGSTSFFHVRINNLYVVAVTKYVGSNSYSKICRKYDPEPTRMLHWSSSFAIVSSTYASLTLERWTKRQ